MKQRVEGIGDVHESWKMQSQIVKEDEVVSRQKIKTKFGEPKKHTRTRSPFPVLHRPTQSQLDFFGLCKGVLSIRPSISTSSVVEP